MPKALNEIWERWRKTIRLMLKWDFKGEYWVEISRKEGCQYNLHGYENNKWPLYVAVHWNTRDGRVKKVAELVYSEDELFLSDGYVCKQPGVSITRENEIMEVRARDRAETEKEARSLAREIRDTEYFYSGY